MKENGLEGRRDKNALIDAKWEWIRNNGYDYTSNALTKSGKIIYKF